MHHLVFSFSKLLGTELHTPEGLPIGVLHDAICNKDSGKITYLLLKAGEPERLFAIHHSFFYLPDSDEHLVFDAKLGREDHIFYLDLPSQYDTIDVLKHTEFVNTILPTLSMASHRSDNESHF